MQAVKDALAQLEPQVDEIVVSTHGAERSGWMRRDVVAGDRARRRRASRSSTSIVERDRTRASERARDREPDGRLATSCSTASASGPRRAPASFLIVAPQSDDEEHDDADRRLRRALSELRSEGIDAHGQVVHPDPYTAARAGRPRRARRRDHRLDVPGRAQRLAAPRPRRAAAQGHRPAGRARRSRPSDSAVHA